MSPPTRPPPRPCARPSRTSSACVASQTVRKQRTWRHSPAATASIAATTAPPWPGDLHPAVEPGRADAQRLLQRGDAALGVAAVDPAARVGGEPVDVGQLEAGVGDRREARVDGQRERVAHEAPADLRHPDARERDLLLELVASTHWAGHRPRRLQRRVVVDRQRGRGRCARGGIVRERLEQGEPHVGEVLERDLHAHADVHVVGIAVDDVGREPDARVLVDRDHGDDVGWREVREPLLVVDREPHDVAAPRHVDDVEVAAAAVRADRARRMQERPAAAAVLDAQDAVGARGPEALVLRGERRHGPVRRFGHEYLLSTRRLAFERPASYAPASDSERREEEE